MSYSYLVLALAGTVIFLYLRERQRRA